MYPVSYLQKSEINNHTELCIGKDRDETLSFPFIFLNFLNEFKDSFFYSYFIQFILVGYMYLRVGHGKYWKTMFYASILGLCGALCEHITVVMVCSKEYQGKLFIIFWLQEIFWILCEYAIPYLNLIKIQAISQTRETVILKYVLVVLFVCFATARVYIGYLRYTEEILFENEIYKWHGVAFGIMSLADILCTIFILREITNIIKREKEKHNTEKTLSEYIRRSSYAILLLVDACSVVLTIFSFLFEIIPNTTNQQAGQSRAMYAVVPFHTVKSNFILILAVDALVFKIGAQAGVNSSSNGPSAATGADSVFKSVISGTNNASLGLSSSLFNAKPLNMSSNNFYSSAATAAAANNLGKANSTSSAKYDNIYKISTTLSGGNAIASIKSPLIESNQISSTNNTSNININTSPTSATTPSKISNISSPYIYSPPTNGDNENSTSSSMSMNALNSLTSPSSVIKKKMSPTLPLSFRNNGNTSPVSPHSQISAINIGNGNTTSTNTNKMNNYSLKNSPQKFNYNMNNMSTNNYSYNNSHAMMLDSDDSSDEDEILNNRMLGMNGMNTFNYSNATYNNPNPPNYSKFNIGDGPGKINLDKKSSKKNPYY